MIRKDLMIAVLAAFCLMATLFLAKLPVSQSEVTNDLRAEALGTGKLSVSYAANAMWVEPPLSVHGIGSNFNITVWMNMTQNVYAYQIGLHYNRTQLKCTRVGFTAGITSDYFKGHTTATAGPLIDTSYLGNGSVLVGETVLGGDFIPGPRSGSLVWAEFYVLVVPGAGNFGSKLDISKEYPSNTYIIDKNLGTISMTPYDGNFLSASLQTVLFFNINPNPASHGQVIVVKGILMDGTYALLANQNIQLYARPLAGSWQYIGSVNTNASGVFTWQATLPNTVTGTFVFASYYPGTTNYLATNNFAILVIQ